MSAVFDTVAKVLIEHLGVEAAKVTPGIRIRPLPGDPHAATGPFAVGGGPNDLGADSLDIVEVVMTIEEEFEIEVPDDEVGRVETVQDLVDLVERHQA